MSLLWPCALTALLLATMTGAVPLPSPEPQPSWCRGADKFHCKAGGKNHDCLPSIWVCNGVTDCVDGEDEDASLCVNYHRRIVCDLSDHFECASNGRCFPNIYLCDKEADCPNGEDEANCAALSHGQTSCGQDRVTCDDGKKCISRIFLCDSFADCYDGTDETHCNCTTGHPFHCADGLRCPPVTALCDGIMDCKDGSDEGGRCEDSSCSLQCNEGDCYRTPSGPRCLCKEGFRETQEGAVESHDAGPCKGDSPAILFFSDQRKVKAMNLATKEEWQVYAGENMVISVAYDPVTKNVYWADRAGKVYWKSLQGDDAPTLLLRLGVKIVYSMAMDWVGRNLYMADRENNRIVVCNVDHITCKSLLTRSIAPMAIKLDIAESHKNRDGLSWVTALGIDPPARKLYWMDSKTGSVEEYNLDQQSRKTIPALEVVHPYSMAVWEDKLYWSDWKTRSLYSAHKKDGRNVTEVIPHFYGHCITIYHEQMLADAKSEVNPCRSSECSHLCLLSPVWPFFTCACPLGMRLSDSHLTCIENKESPLPTLIAGIESNIYQLKMQEFQDPRVTLLTRADTNFKSISDLDYDPVTKDLFIADQGDGKIVKMNLETKLRTILISDAIRPTGIAVDWARKNLYWVDSMKNTLGVVTTDGRFRTKLDVEMCSGLDVEVSQSAGRVVVACERPHARILSCTRQGDPCTVLASGRVQTPIGLSGRVQTPIGLTIDRRAVPDVVYWSDVYSYSVQRVSLDGSNRQVIRMERPAAVMFTDNKLFLSTVGHFHSIFASTNLFREKKWTEIHLNTQEELPWGHEGHIALTAINWHHQQVYTERSYDHFCLANTACEQLCLENELKERVCGCSNGMVLAEDNRTCATSLCPPDNFRCPDDFSCIPNIMICNGIKDCYDGADERRLMCITCEATSFRCQSGECVDVARVCDGHAHCEDKSDEANCHTEPALKL